MILEIKIANYRSIHEEQTISFLADSGRTHPDNLIKRNGLRVLKTLALFGPNASGKSNLCRAIDDIVRFILRSATRIGSGDAIFAAQPFRLDPAMTDAPSRFEITFLYEGQIYRYGFAVTRKRVHEEYLYLDILKSGKETLLFHRRLASDREQLSWEFGGPLTQDETLLRERTPENALVLSVGDRENVSAIQPLFVYLCRAIRTIRMSHSPENLLTVAAQLYKNDPYLTKRLLQLLDSVDISLENIEIDGLYGTPVDEDQSADNAEDFLASRLRQDSVAGFMPFTISVERRDSAGKLQRFNLERDESIGTQRLFSLTALILLALDAGGFFVVDELDSSMHPLLTRRLIEMFQSPELNMKGAQLLFTTHDAILFDPVLFRRDQILLAEKRRGGSQFYALADMEPPPRNTGKFLRNYLSGRYGGTPYFGLDYERIVDKVNP